MWGKEKEEEKGEEDGVEGKEDKGKGEEEKKEEEEKDDEKEEKGEKKGEGEGREGEGRRRKKHTGTGRRRSLQRKLKRGQRGPGEKSKCIVKPMGRRSFKRKEPSKMLKTSKIQSKVKTEYILLNLTFLWLFVLVGII